MEKNSIQHIVDEAGFRKLEIVERDIDGSGMEVSFENVDFHG